MCQGAAVPVAPVRTAEVDPAADAGLAAELRALQRAAYAVEAALIGDDRIPPLHEELAQLTAAPLRWLGAFLGDRLVGAVAWTADGERVDVDRLVVDPARHRSGVGAALVRAVLDRAEGRPVTVSTGRDNTPARRLYERAGFVVTGEREVLPGLWVSSYAHSGDELTVLPWEHTGPDPG